MQLHDKIFKTPPGKTLVQLPDDVPWPELVLRTDLIRPGDVLLTRSKGLEARLIARLGGGEFSHAALCLDYQRTFESDGEIIGFRQIDYLGWAEPHESQIDPNEVPGDLGVENLKNIHEISMGKEHKLAQIGKIPGDEPPGKIILGAVYRHPQIAKLCENAFLDHVSGASNKFTQALDEEMQESYGKDYSELYRLISIAKLPGSLKSLAFLKHITHKLFEIFENHNGANKIYGPFCSELVVQFCNRLNFPQFNPVLKPEQVTPNDFARADISNFALVKGAVLTTKELVGRYKQKNDGLDEGWNLLDVILPKGRDPFAEQLNKFLKNQKENERINEEIMRQLEELVKKWGNRK